MNETQLILALQQKQQSAFKYLVETHKDRLYNTVLGFVQNQADAEDVLQDVFIKAFESIHQFKQQASLATWLYRIAVTQSLDFLRRKKRAGRLSAWLGLNKQQQSDAYDGDHPGVLAENKERAKHLFTAIKALPENQKIAFLLQKTVGLNQKEIAEIMDVKEGAVESLLSRAKVNLKKLLYDYYSS